jgi:hypothetical protein
MLILMAFLTSILKTVDLYRRRSTVFLKDKSFGIAWVRVAFIVQKNDASQLLALIGWFFPWRC